jgi:hypothetical protein
MILWIIMMISAVIKSTIFRIRDSKKLAILLMSLIVQKQELDLWVRDKNKKFLLLMIIRNLKEFIT